MNKYNRSYYCKQITRALKHANKGKLMHGNELRFYDDLDWEVVGDRGVWTDVYLQYGGNSVFAFTVSSSFASCECMTGSAPEAIRELDTGLWDLYIHKKYITQEDVGKLCLKWVRLQAPIPNMLACNIRFNKERYGHVWSGEQYPPRRIDAAMDDIYGIERYTPIKMGRGPCS